MEESRQETSDMNRNPSFFFLPIYTTFVRMFVTQTFNSTQHLDFSNDFNFSTTPSPCKMHVVQSGFQEFKKASRSHLKKILKIKVGG
jgi:hypothetical protein